MCYNVFITKIGGVEMDRNTSEYYTAARRQAVKEYSRNVSMGRSGYLPFLEGLLKNIDVVSEANLGLVEIPLEKVKGTYTYARSLSFAGNFMPLLKESTEFANKWTALCNAHLNEGITHPIKVYEYLNFFYVVEGNKRVSVLKFFDAYSITGEVVRLVPRWDENDEKVRIYYEFMDFYKKTGINAIWFSREGSFHELWNILKDFKPKNDMTPFGFRYFANSVYLPFRRAYLDEGGRELSITTGDAFLEYLKLYGIPDGLSSNRLKSRLKKFIVELRSLNEKSEVEIQTRPEPVHDKGFVSSITTFIKPKMQLKVAFAYAKSIQQSSWSHSHNWGRMHVERVLGEQVTTAYVENVPENINAYSYFKQLAEDGNDVVFATSPAFINAALKAALEYPNTRFLNCSQTHSFKNVKTYFGRIYEARFLAGIIAGAMTKTGILGYVGTRPVQEVVSGINAFVSGARLVNPRVVVKVGWSLDWDSDENSLDKSIELINSGADIVSHHNTLANKEFCRQFGIYSMICNVNREKCMPDEYLASPVWNWGIFYEKIIQSILNGTWSRITDIFSGNSKVVNFWWGLGSGIVDIFYSRRLVPVETQKLVDFMKRTIAGSAYHPFTGPIYDNNGALRIESEQTAGHDMILSMNWFVNGVEGKLPDKVVKTPGDDLLAGTIQD
jgi:basic membrane protein A and related proteins